MAEQALAVMVEASVGMVGPVAAAAAAVAAQAAEVVEAARMGDVTVAVAGANAEASAEVGMPAAPTVLAVMGAHVVVVEAQRVLALAGWAVEMVAAELVGEAQVAA